MPAVRQGQGQCEGICQYGKSSTPDFSPDFLIDETGPDRLKKLICTICRDWRNPEEGPVKPFQRTSKANHLLSARHSRAAANYAKAMGTNSASGGSIKSSGSGEEREPLEIPRFDDSQLHKRSFSLLPIVNNPSSVFAGYSLEDGQYIHQETGIGVKFLAGEVDEPIEETTAFEMDEILNFEQNLVPDEPMHQNTAEEEGIPNAETAYEAGIDDFLLRKSKTACLGSENDAFYPYKSKTVSFELCSSLFNFLPGYRCLCSITWTTCLERRCLLMI